jgi:hypothetical protein
MKPWLTLIGGRPGSFPQPSTDPTDPNQFWGGVSLETFAQNDKRITHLMQKDSISASDIYLLYNPNSEVAAAEVSLWKKYNAGPAVQAGRNPSTGDNDASTYQTAFQNISAKAVIISADPFFQTTKDVLIQQANRWVSNAPSHIKRRVCYPIGEFKSHGAQGHRTFHGPSLEAAYTLLGKKAAGVINNGVPATLDPQTIGTPDDDET